MTEDYMIIKRWSVNNRQNNVSINIPKKFAEKHKLLDAKYIKITDKGLDGGLVIKALDVLMVEDVN